MAEIRENIANNIVRLRKASGMSQAALADKMHYTDKAISKWERAESTPDVDSLADLAKIFNVSIQYLFESHLEVEAKTKEEERIKKDSVKSYAMFGLVITAVWFISLVIFLYGVLTPGTDLAQSSLAFVWAVPASSLCAIEFGRRRKYHLWILISISLLLWSLLSAIFATMYLTGFANMWYVYVIGVPLQIAIILGYLILRNR